MDQKVTTIKQKQRRNNVVLCHDWLCLQCETWFFKPNPPKFCPNCGRQIVEVQMAPEGT